MLLTVLAAAAAAAAQPPPRACLETSPTPIGWTPVDDHTLVARSGAKSFKVTTAACPALRDPLPRITLVLGGASTICNPRDARLFVSHDALSPTPCFMQTLEPITPDQEKTLLRRRSP